MFTNFPEPDYPAALGLISHLGIEELKEMLNDDIKFEELIKDIKQIKDLETEKEMIIASNRSLAEFNLAKEPQLEEGKQLLQELSTKGESLCHSIENKISELKSRSGDMSLDTALALLQTAAAESEEDSETVAEKFLEGDLELEGFLEQFSTKRKLMHLRRVKADKMVELLTERKRHVPSQLHNHNIPQGLPHAAAPWFNPLPPVVGAPYPVGNMNMPMPSAHRSDHLYA